MLVSIMTLNYHAENEFKKQSFSGKSLCKRIKQSD